MSVQAAQKAGEILRQAMQPPVVEEQSETAQPEVAQEAEVEEVVEETQLEESSEAPVEEEQVQEEVIAEEQDGGVSISTLSELAEAIEVDSDFLYGINIPLADGQEAVPLSVLKDHYQNKSLESQELQTQLDTERTNFEQQKAEYDAQIAKAMMGAQQAPAELQNAQAEMMAISNQYNAYDWSQLEEADPGKAALLKQNMATSYSQAQGKVQQLQEDLYQKQQVQANEMQRKNETQLLSTIKEWSDPLVRQTEWTQMGGLLREYGFTQNEVDHLFDYRTAWLVRDLMKLKGTLKEAGKVTKKVTKAPKVLRPGAPKSAPAGNRKLAAQINTATKSRDNNVKVNAIGNLLNSANVRRR